MLFKVKASQQPTVSCGDIITDSDSDDSGLWCVAQSWDCMVISVVCYLQADIPVIMHLSVNKGL